MDPLLQKHLNERIVDGIVDETFLDLFQEKIELLKHRPKLTAEPKTLTVLSFIWGYLTQEFVDYYGDFHGRDPNDSEWVEFDDWYVREAVPEIYSYLKERIP